ncbi:hypothetical protein QA635_33975 [Bradyrhizobium brasilense]|uniref:hypothetical protein n=1 Tax=Bradyrhizobium brasilense TaxID=1419277 RepID=UPI0024B0DF71|nr:hypothetical protein [Bradyrhizobium australafricanum]WFU31492.1 hypothetical protein QA635_33975 [Bradyrhizobium australafricanum]
MADDRSVGNTSGTEERSPDAVRMYGDFLDNVTVVKNSLMSLLLAVGSIEGGAPDQPDKAPTGESAPGRPVLVPFVEMKLEGEQEPYFANVLTLDNVAYLIYDLTQDFKVVCEQLLTVTRGGMPPEAGRIELSKEWMKLASEQAADAFRDLETISSSLERSP